MCTTAKMSLLSSPVFKPRLRLGQKTLTRTKHAVFGLDIQITITLGQKRKYFGRFARRGKAESSNSNESEILFSSMYHTLFFTSEKRCNQNNNSQYENSVSGPVQRFDLDNCDKINFERKLSILACK
jgi:hypothetical protein